jgi:23S rRNA (cytidine1920-2'-O)/16S rRNA (cytidine1409-2'-O)-methyltransferase
MSVSPRSDSAQRARLDAALVERGLVESRSRAQALIMAGAVRVDGRPAVKPSQLVDAEAGLEIAARHEFVSRGGHKLNHALDRFGIDVDGLVCGDIGASTGGFTDCLLRRGARRVYAIDVGRGQLDWGLRNDPRVVVMERTNIRHVERLPESLGFASIDVSFISLRLVLPIVARLIQPRGAIVALIKPQFEAGRGEVGRGGVVRDPAVHRRVLHEFWAWCRQHGLVVRGLTASPIRGPAGNVEFLASLSLQLSEDDRESVGDGADLIDAALDEVPLHGSAVGGEGVDGRSLAARG